MTFDYSTSEPDSAKFHREMFARFPFSSFAVAFALAGSGAGGSNGAAPPLTSIEQIKRLSYATVDIGMAVRLEGIVTVVRTNQEWSLLFHLQAGKEAIGVEVKKLDQAPRRGQRIVVEGEMKPGHHTVLARRFMVLGTAALPTPVPVTGRELTDPWLHDTYVEVSGTVRRSKPLNDHHHGLSLRLGSEQIAVELHDGPHPELTSLVGARVRLRGAIGGLFNKDVQRLGTVLHLQDVGDLQVERAAPPEPFALPARPFGSLLQSTLDDDLDALIKVRGVVTARHGLEVFLSDGTRGLRLFCRSEERVSAGDEVEALGFIGRGAYSPVLEDAWLKPGGRSAPPAVISTKVADLLIHNKDAVLVSLEAELVGNATRAGEREFTLRAGDRLFTATLPVDAPSLASLSEGSLLGLTGVCAVTSEVDPGTSIQLRPKSFRLVLRSPADVVVLRAPPWWTSQRMWWLLLGALALIVGALTWAWMLRRRVVAQTVLIADGLKHTATLEERTRLAREFHDTLEQELTGLALQIETAQATLPHAPERSSSVLMLLSRLARRCVEEAGLAVLDLRSSALETGDLRTALVDASAAAFVGKETGVSFTLEGESRRLPSRIEHALLRVVQEAATNAAKHARATNFEVVLKIETDCVTLRLADDGCGFIPETSLKVGQFGLLGIRERIEKINGHFELHSQPGTGTRIEITVPLNSTST